MDFFCVNHKDLAKASSSRIFFLEILKTRSRVSFKTSFDSKQPKLEPKLVSVLSKTKRLFRLFHFYTETETFDVSKEPKQTEDQPKQFGREHILFFFYRKFKVFPFFPFFFCFFRFVSKPFVSVVSLLYRNREFRLNRNKQKTQKNSLKDSIFGNFSENLELFRFVSVCYETDLFFFGCFDIGSKHWNKLKFFLFGFTKQTETNAKQILFRFVSVRTKIYFCLFRGHPNP